MYIQFRKYYQNMQIRYCLLLCIGLFQTLSLIAQEKQVIEAKIVDEVSRKPLPYATIYVAPHQGTISNQEGEFSIAASPEDKVRISYVGYEPQMVKASEMPAVVLLKPMAVRLNEITVKPLDLHKFLLDVLAKIKEDNKAHRKATNSFFYRQITKTNAVCNEILEAFFNATPHISILNPELITGRYAGLPSDSVHKYMHFRNFFYNSQMRPVILSKRTKFEKDKIVQPLFKDYQKYYTVAYDVLYDSNNGSTIYRINFKPRKEVENPILSGNLFIDSSTLELKRFEGEVVNHILTMTDGSNGNKERIKDSKTYFSINYKTTKGASFVEYVAVDMRCTTKALGKINVHSVMYNVGDEVSHQTKQLGKSSDLLSKIAGQKYDPSYWKEKTIIKRTPLEKSVTEMFERENLFGTYTLDEYRIKSQELK